MSGNYSIVETIGKFLRWSKRHSGFIIGSTLLGLAAAIIFLHYRQPDYQRQSAFSPKWIDSNVFTNERLNNKWAKNPYAQGISMENAIVLFNSPAFIEKAVVDLELDKKYLLKGFAGKTTDLYHHSPIDILCDSKTMPEFTMDFHINQELTSCTIDNISIDGEKMDNAPIHAPFEKEIATPAGKIMIFPTKTIKEYGNATIRFEKTTPAKAAYDISTRLRVSKIAEYTDVLLCVYHDPVPERADELLNELPLTFDRLWREWNAFDNSKVKQTLENQIKVHSERLEKIEAQIAGIKSSGNYLSIQKEIKKLAFQQTEGADTLFQNGVKRHVANILIKQLSEETSEFHAIALPSAKFATKEINELILRHNDLVGKLRNAINNGGKNNPMAKEINGRINALRPVIIQSIEKELNALEISDKQQHDRIAKADKALLSLTKDATNLRKLMRDLLVTESNYISLRDMQEADLSKVNNISEAYRIISPAFGKDQPQSLPAIAVILLALLTGALLIPAAAYIVAQAIGNQIRDEKELDNTDIPIAGSIPQYKPMPIRSMICIKLFRGFKSLTPPDKIVGQVQYPHIDEAFRKIRTNIDLMDNGEKSQVLLLTSANPGSGKSFIAFNLATSIAMKGEHVLIVDCDVRRATLSKTIGSPHLGFSYYLQHPSASLNNLIIKNSPVENVDILPAGESFTNNPADILVSNRIDHLFDLLRQNYDRIIIDSAPIDIVTDTSIIKRVADRTLFVIRIGLFERNMLPLLNDIHKNGRLPKLTITINGTR